MDVADVVGRIVDGGDEVQRGRWAVGYGDRKGGIIEPAHRRGVRAGHDDGGWIRRGEVAGADLDRASAPLIGGSDREAGRDGPMTATAIGRIAAAGKDCRSQER